MISGRLIVVICSLLLVGCVTTREGDLSDKEEAARLNLDLGLGYLRQGNYNEARLKLEKSINEQPDNPTAHRALGLVYERLDDIKGAEKEYRLAVSQAPDDADALDQLAAFLCGQGEQKEALKLFDKAVTIPLYQDRHRIFTNAGTCVKKTDLPQAKTYLRQALGLRPNYPEALLQMGEISFMEQNYIQARAFVSRYMDASSANPLVLWLGYRTEIALRDPDAANVFADQLLKGFPDSTEATLLQEQRRNAG
jgi:type IV pilus assembly protein PilF